MNIRTIAAIGIFGALLALAIMIVYRPAERNLSRLSFEEMTTNVVDKIAVKGEESFEIAKRGETWELDDGRPADPELVKRALDSLSTLVATELVSSREAKHAEFEVDSEKGRQVTAYVDDRSVADLIIGRVATIGGTYVRRADSDDVYVINNTPLHAYFAPTRKQWLRLKLFDATLNDTATMNVSFEDGSGFTLSQTNDSTWELEDRPNDFRLDPSRANTLVSTFLNLRAKEILDARPDRETSGLDPEENHDAFTLTLKNGVIHTLLLGALDKDEQAHYARLNGDQYLLIPTYAADNIRKRLNDLRALTLMDFDPAQARKLAITSGEQTRIFEKTDGAWSVAHANPPAPSDFELDGAAVERSVEDLSKVRASAYVAEAPTALPVQGTQTASSAGFRTRSATVEVTLDSGETARLLLGAELKEGAQTVYYAKGNADSGTYLVPEHEVSQFIATGLDAWSSRPPASRPSS